MWQIRGLSVVASVLLVVAPLSAQAQSLSDQEAQNEAVIAQNQASAMAAYLQVKHANDVARCQIVAAGGTVPGDHGECTLLSSPLAPPAATTPSSASPTGGACVEAQRPLTTAEFDVVNDFAISVNHALSNNLPAPAMSPEVSALIGCL